MTIYIIKTLYSLTKRVNFISISASTNVNSANKHRISVNTNTICVSTYINSISTINVSVYPPPSGANITAIKPSLPRTNAGPTLPICYTAPVSVSTFIVSVNTNKVGAYSFIFFY